MNTELKKSLEMRQENLIGLLKTKKDQLEPHKQHQIYGAINEIDYILRMMKVTEEDQTELVTAGSDDVSEVVTVQKKTRTFKMPFKIKFQKE